MQGCHRGTGTEPFGRKAAAFGSIKARISPLNVCRGHVEQHAPPSSQNTEQSITSWTSCSVIRSVGFCGFVLIFKLKVFHSLLPHLGVVKPLSVKQNRSRFQDDPVLSGANMQVNKHAGVDVYLYLWVSYFSTEDHFRSSSPHRLESERSSRGFHHLGVVSVTKQEMMLCGLVENSPRAVEGTVARV